jgi:hypothetical protein
VVAAIGAEDADSLLAHGDGEELEVVFGEQSLSGCEKSVRVVSGYASGEREFAEVGADGGGAGVFAEVGGLGIYEDGDACRSSGMNDGGAERLGDCSLGVVGEDDGVDLGCEFSRALDQALRVDGGKAVAALDVEAQELLIAAYDAGFRDGGIGAGDYAYGVDAGFCEDSCKFQLLGVVSPEAAEEGLAAEAG